MRRFALVYCVPIGCYKEKVTTLTNQIEEQSVRKRRKAKPMQSLFTLPLVGSFGELVLMGGTLWRDTLCWIKVGREGGGSGKGE